MASPSAQEIVDLLATLHWKDAGQSAAATILFSRSDVGEPLQAEEIALIPETRSGSLLVPVHYPDPGPVPEVITVGSTASLEFAFKTTSSDPVRRVLLVLKGRVVTFDV